MSDSVVGGTSIIHHSSEGVFILCNIWDLLIYRKNLYLEYRLKEIGKFSDSQVEGIWDFLGKQEFRTSKDKLTDEFCDILHDGYGQGKDQNLLKAKYIDVLNDACKMIDLTLAGCIACIENDSDIISSFIVLQRWATSILAEWQKIKYTHHRLKFYL